MVWTSYRKQPSSPLPWCIRTPGLGSFARSIRQANGVLVDLHGAVGSPNDQQHTEILDGQTNLFDMLSKCVNVPCSATGPVNNIVGIQILNEPRYQCLRISVSFIPCIFQIMEILPPEASRRFDRYNGDIKRASRERWITALMTSTP